ncbi:MAG: hypothetical protein LBI89_04045 [Prevotellaceae bacterium]|jgi:hypothetical protein|nr:hypothetical protein [Prevotellaceae bacterium]
MNTFLSLSISKIGALHSSCKNAADNQPGAPSHHEHEAPVKKRISLADILAKESKAVHLSSSKILRKFEAIEIYDLSTI